MSFLLRTLPERDHEGEAWVIPASRLNKKAHPPSGGWFFVLGNDEKACFWGGHKNKKTLHAQHEAAFLLLSSPDPGTRFATRRTAIPLFLTFFVQNHHQEGKVRPASQHNAASTQPDITDFNLSHNIHVVNQITGWNKTFFNPISKLNRNFMLS